MKINLDGLGMKRENMLELINRLNLNDKKNKWYLIEYGYQNMANPFNINLYQNGLVNHGY